MKTAFVTGIGGQDGTYLSEPLLGNMSAKRSQRYPMFPVFSKYPVNDDPVVPERIVS